MHNSRPATVAALSIAGLSVEFPMENGPVKHAVTDFSLSVSPGEIHALVGESGAGKSTIGNALMGLIPNPGRIAGGSIHIAGRKMDTIKSRTSGIRQGRDIGAIFQDPLTSLNPLFTIGSQLGETMRYHLGISRDEAKRRSLDLLESVGLPDPVKRFDAYPHQLSGGQRQRVVIAAALCCDPQLIVADEPTTALDVSVQAQILKLLRSLADDRGVGIVLITHNMGVVSQIADRLTVMRHGRAIETGKTRDVLLSPQEPYSRVLIDAVPRLDVTLDRFPLPANEDARLLAARDAVRKNMQASRRKTSDGPILSVEDLTVDYGRRGFWPLRKPPARPVLDSVSFSVNEGEIFGIVGESGCGKSTLANAIAGLKEARSGSINLFGEAVGTRRSPQERQLLQMVFQDPFSALNARMRIRKALVEPLAYYDMAGTNSQASEDAALLLEAVGLERASGNKFPHAFSGGERQRLAIARALAPRPGLLICDEPTSALDVSVQAQILNLLKDIRDMAGLSIILISHDLAVVRQMCDRVAVMHEGQIVEMADTATIFARPQHEYTKSLLAAVPALPRSDQAQKQPTGSKAQ